MPQVVGSADLPGSETRPTARMHRTAQTDVARLDALTSLRFIAAAMIVMLHSQGAAGLYYPWLEPLPLVHGVSFFFVLSGFILSYVYSDLSWRDAPRFWWARIARLWPAHVASFALVMLLLAPSRLQPSDSVVTAFANLLMIHAWIPIQAFYFSFNAPSWSISTEFGFYLLFPVLILGLRRTWALKLALSIVLLAATLVAANRLGGTQLSAGYSLEMHGLAYISPLARLFEFVAGMCTWLLWNRTRRRLHGSVVWCTLGELAALGLTISLMYVSAVGVPLWRAAFGEAGVDWFLVGGGSTIGFACLIFFVAMNDGLLARVLKQPPLVLLGEISYSVYLVHQVLLRRTDDAAWFLAIPVELRFPLFWLCLIVISYAIWRFVERPSRRLLVGLAGGSATQPDASRARVKPDSDGHPIGTASAAIVGVTACAAVVIWLQVHSAKHVMWQEFFQPPGPQAPVALLDVAPPKHWSTGERQVYRLVATNIGDRTWYAAKPAQVLVHVRFIGPDEIDRVDERTEEWLPIPAPVPPGGVLEMSLRTAAPRKEGRYRLQLRLEIDPYFRVESASAYEDVVEVRPRR